MTTTPAERKAKTRSEEVYSAVRVAILNGLYTPGEKLSPSVLSQEFGVSLSVVREALTRLAQQGLVVSQPQIGFQVTPISREDLLDLTSVRLDIETLALRRSVENGDLEWRSELLAAHYVLEHTPQHVEEEGRRIHSEDWQRAHALYHERLLAGCGSTRLLEIASSLRDSADLYRRWSEPIGGDVTRDIAGEHRAILEAVQAGDPDLAVEKLAAHISHTTNVLLKHAT